MRTRAAAERLVRVRRAGVERSVVPAGEFDEDRPHYYRGEPDEGER